MCRHQQAYMWWHSSCLQTRVLKCTFSTQLSSDVRWNFSRYDLINSTFSSTSTPNSRSLDDDGVSRHVGAQMLKHRHAALSVLCRAAVGWVRVRSASATDWRKRSDHHEERFWVCTTQVQGIEEYDGQNKLCKFMWAMAKYLLSENVALNIWIVLCRYCRCC